MIEIKTDRLILRPSILDDATDIQKYFNNWEIIKWLKPPVPWPYPPNGAIEHLTAICKKESCNSFAILLPNKSTVIGTIRLECFSDNNKVIAERGFCLDQNYWGSGLMSEASAAVNDYAFINTEIQKIIAFNAKNNIKSRKIKEAQGFIYKETKTIDPSYHEGCAQEEEWELTKEVWQNLALK